MSDYLKIAEAAKLKGCSRMQIYRALQEGKLDNIAMNGKAYVHCNKKFDDFTVARKEKNARTNLLQQEQSASAKLLQEVQELRERVTRLEAIALGKLPPEAVAKAHSELIQQFTNDVGSKLEEQTDKLKEMQAGLAVSLNGNNQGDKP
jgi:predicted site-specific integrase-resolvase